MRTTITAGNTLNIMGHGKKACHLAVISGTVYFARGRQATVNDPLLNTTLMSFTFDLTNSDPHTISVYADADAEVQYVLE